jgi:hypothetical protein
MGNFASTTHAQVQGDAVVFELTLHGEPRRFEISGDALRECFGADEATGAALLKAFENGRPRILEAAEAARSTPNDGTIELGTGDFE